MHFQFEKSRTTERKAIRQLHVTIFCVCDPCGTLGSSMNAARTNTLNTHGAGTQTNAAHYIPLRRPLRESPDSVTSRVPRNRSFALVKSKQKHTETNHKKERDFHTRMAAPLHGRSIKRRRSKHPKGPGAEDENGGATTTKKLSEENKKSRER